MKMNKTYICFVKATMFNNFGLNFIEDVKCNLGQRHCYHAVMICMCLQYLPLYKLYKWHNGNIYIFYI